MKSPFPKALSKPPTVNAQEMRRLDYWASREFQLPPLVLMENAGRLLADFLLARFKPKRPDVTVALVGAGINGGAVLAAARILAHRGYAATGVLTELPQKLGADTRRQLTMFRREGGSVPTPKRERQLPAGRLLLDGITGYSLGDSVKGNPLDLIRLANASESSTISLDVPSGLHPDSGKVAHEAIEADATLAIAFPKQGVVEPGAGKYVGELYLADAGYPRDLYADFDTTPEGIFGDAPIVRLDQ